MRSIISYCRRRCIICVRVQIHTQNYWKHLFHSPLTVESVDAQYACGAFFFAYASVLAPKCHHFCLRQTPGRAWSRYALQVFSFAGCTSRVLAGIFFIPGRQRDAGLNSFWVQRYFYLSNTLSGIRVCLRRPPRSGRRRLGCFVQALYKPSPFSFGTRHVGIAAGFVQGLRGEVVGGRLYANRSKPARGKESVMLPACSAVRFCAYKPNTKQASSAVAGITVKGRGSSHSSMIRPSFCK